MDEGIRRAAGLILEAPLTRRNRRELLYCGLGGLAGALGFLILVALLAFGLTVSVSVLGTVIGLLLITVTLRLSRRLGSLHRRLSNRLLGQHVEAPQRFQPGTGLLGRLDRRLRDRPAWRAICYSLVKLPVAFVQFYAVALTVCGLIDVLYPVIWTLFHQHSSSPMVVLQPLAFGGSFKVYGWLGSYLAALFGAALAVAGAWVARGINAGDRVIVEGMLNVRPGATVKAVPMSSAKPGEGTGNIKSVTAESK